jgi:A/G-specific adenine glycosylase
MTHQKPSTQSTQKAAQSHFTHGSRNIRIDAKKISQFHRVVFSWFAEHGRDLPWRKTQDPYAITLSEIMLQQTQVDRVIPKWRACLEVFPTWQDLAHAKPSDVLRMWKGLGYNRRALMLHRLAQRVVENGGELPSDIETMKRLPGIGSYTANAIAAFAFRHPDAAPVDTNIRRIFRRVFPRCPDDPKSVQQLAYGVRPLDVWTWNHALMDIGALHCTAKGHDAALCVLAEVHGEEEKHEEMTKKTKRNSSLRFEDTDRYYRGRIVDVLREGPTTLRRLRANPLFDCIDKKRFATLVNGVVHDGIVEQKKHTVFLVGDA